MNARKTQRKSPTPSPIHTHVTMRLLRLCARFDVGAQAVAHLSLEDEPNSNAHMVVEFARDFLNSALESVSHDDHPDTMTAWADGLDSLALTLRDAGTWLRAAAAAKAKVSA